MAIDLKALREVQEETAGTAGEAIDRNLVILKAFPDLLDWVERAYPLIGDVGSTVTIEVGKIREPLWVLTEDTIAEARKLMREINDGQ